MQEESKQELQQQKSSASSVKSAKFLSQTKEIQSVDLMSAFPHGIPQVWDPQPFSLPNINAVLRLYNSICPLVFKIHRKNSPCELTHFQLQENKMAPVFMNNGNVYFSAEEVVQSMINDQSAVLTSSPESILKMVSIENKRSTRRTVIYLGGSVVSFGDLFPESVLLGKEIAIGLLSGGGAQFTPNELRSMGTDMIHVLNIAFHTYSKKYINSDTVIIRTSLIETEKST